MIYCQGPKCHTYTTQDRIRGSRGDKHYETRKRKHMLFDLFCDNRCWSDWTALHGQRAVAHFGSTHEPKRTNASSAWYKSARYNGWNNGSTRYNHYIVNDLLGERILITEQQYNNKNFTSPT